ncbi:disks large-associated protein 5 isoform X2 [Ascaphus truei]|uniref:disks large-associated protein 5 isoform X2 n=1 Tax=Ascaphus truei TaxID=8439 RepID=UPI003F5A7700
MHKAQDSESIQQKMEVRSQFTRLYKKDLSTENLRAKVARRKSLSQKENRHKEFRKSRGLALADVNISTVKENDLTQLEEVEELSLPKGHDSKPKVTAAAEHLLRLQRFKEEKQLRKLKEQREKAKRGIFKCGLYKPDVAFPLITSIKVKQDEKPAPPAVTRITRSMAKAEPTTKLTARSQRVTAGMQNRSHVTAERAIPKGRGQSSTVKKNEKANRAVPPLRTTRATVATAAKVPTKSTAVVPLSVAVTKKNKAEETAKNKIIEQIVDQCSLELKEPEVPLKDTALEIVKPVNAPVRERKISFAPQNFVFQPMDGLPAFNFQPMTPRGANAFLSPCFTWSPMKLDRTHSSASLKPDTEEKELDQMLIIEQNNNPDACELKTAITLATQKDECMTAVNPVASDVVPSTVPPLVPSAEMTQRENKSVTPEGPDHDVPYFRDVLKWEIKRLSVLCNHWDVKIQLDIPEEAKDLIRTTVGQTRLLINDRFKQFEGLVDNCEFKRGEKETTCTDLDGFWDMIYFQIEDVNKKFAGLGKLEEKSWQQSSAQTKKVVRRKTVPAAISKPSQGDEGRAAARNRLAAIKLALKNKCEPGVEVSAPELPMQVETVLFDAGFFRIESPAKGVRASRGFSQTSTTKALQHSENPCPNDLADAVESLQAPSTSNDVKSPVRKVLFDTTKEEGVCNTETCPMVPDADNGEVVNAFNVSDFGKYVAVTERFSSGVGQSQSEDLSMDEDLLTAPVVDDVFMCSPEKAVHSLKIDSALVINSTIPADAEAKTASDPLDFLGCNTPSHLNEVHPGALKDLRFGAVASTNDLIVFSPLEK